MCQHIKPANSCPASQYRCEKCGKWVSDSYFQNNHMGTYNWRNAMNIVADAKIIIKHNLGCYNYREVIQRLVEASADNEVKVKVDTDMRGENLVITLDIKE